MRGYDEGQEQPESDTGEIKANRVSCSILNEYRAVRRVSDNVRKRITASARLWLSYSCGQTSQPD